MDTDDSERLAALEREVSALRLEVASLRVQVAQPALAAAPVAPVPTRAATPTFVAPEPVVRRFEPPPPRPATPPRARRSLEELVGRYGTIVIATVTLLVGVGAFLSWAIKHGLLGPTMRVALGYLAAAAVAGVGARFRLRGTRPFGNVLLAMALCVVHLVSWSAGPLLHVVPSAAALAIAFAASAVLARFALRHDEQTLCAIGFGGAAIAPIITGDGSNDVIALALYGVIVIALSAAALGQRAWRNALGVTVGTILLYVGILAAVRPLSTAWPWIVDRLGVLFPLGVVLVLLPLTNVRPRPLLIRVAALALILGAIARSRGATDLWTLGLTSAGALLALGALDRLRPGTRADAASVGRGVGRGWNAALDPLALLDALALPLGLFVAATVAVHPLLSNTTALVASAWSLLAGWMSYRRRAEPESEYFAGTATLTALVVAPAAFSEHERSTVLGLALTGLVLGFAALRLPRLAFRIGAVAAVALASVWAVAMLADRRDFDYAPFLTSGSAVALATVVAWLVLLCFDRLSRRSADMPASRVRHVPLLGAALTAFFWTRAELAGAWSVTASTVLLVVYYASTGTFTIWLGRGRGPKELRVAGLALTLWAACKVLAEALNVANVAVRVGLYFAVSAFLMAVAYGYRKGAKESSPAKSAPD